MADVLPFVILGAATGGLYAISALGLVVVFRTSGVVNFGHGAIGLVGTFIYYELYEKAGLPYGLAVAGGVTASAIVGVLVHLLLMTPLRSAPLLSRVIATLAVVLIVQALATLRYPVVLLIVGGALPTDDVSILGARVGWDRVVILAIASALTVLLWLLYRRSDFGRKSAAVAESPEIAATVGISTGRIALANWALGSGLAGVAGILLVPITGLSVGGALSLIVPVIAVGVVGRFSSFPLTFAAGITLGIAQSLSARYISVSGVSSALPFVLIALGTVAAGEHLLSRDVPTARLAAVGSGRRRLDLGIFAVGLALFAVWFLLPTTWVDAMTVTAAVGLILLSLVVATGYTGQLSLAQFSLAGFGALVAARSVTELNTPFALAALVGAAATIPLSLIVGLAALRARGVSLAIATLGFAVVLEALVFRDVDLAGGLDGIRVGAPSVAGVSLNPITHPERYASLVFVVVLAASLVVGNLRRGVTGRRLLAIRSNELAAKALGIAPGAGKLYGFVVAGTLAGLGGVLLTFKNPVIVFTQFDSLKSVNSVTQVVIGGIGWIAGPLLGAPMARGGIGSRIGDWFGEDAFSYVELAGGVLLCVMLLQAPDGLAKLNAHVLQRGWRELRRGAQLVVRRGRASEAVSGPTPIEREPEPEVAAPNVIRYSSYLEGLSDGQGGRCIGAWSVGGSHGDPSTVPQLDVTSLRVVFGGVVAVDNVSLDVSRGEVVGLIGPNGAGKSTVVDAISGFVSPSRGTIRFGGEVIDRHSAVSRSRMGLSRTFQSLQLFEDLTILENLQCATDQHRKAPYITDLIWPGKGELPDHALDVVDRLDLAGDLDRQPRELSHGKRRLAAIGRAIVASPTVLMLDEPASGLDDHELLTLAGVIEWLARAWGLGVLLIEHDVGFVFDACDRAIVLQMGTVIAAGTPSEIATNREVQSAYLGSAGDDRIGV